MFAERGWEIPTDLGELGDLVDQIEETDDLAPWCFSIESGSATGWPATDWIEDWMLRRAGPEIYDDWVRGDLPFASPVVAGAFDAFRSLVLDPGRTAGDTRSIVLTPVETQAEIFSGPNPPCALYKQADLALDWFRPGVEIGPDGDIDFFVLPADTETEPLLVGGFLAVAFVDRPDVHAVMQALASPAGSAVWREAGTFIGPFDNDPDPESATGRINDLIRDGRVLRFDASDSMPASVGTDLLWDLTTRWVAGSIDQAGLAEQVDEAFGNAR